MKISSIAIAISVTLLGMTAASSAHAKDFDVQYNNAELKTPAGAERVYLRIYDVAKDLCEYEFSHAFATKSQTRFNRCLRRTVKEFVWQIDNPNINQVYASLPVKRIRDRREKAVEFVENKSR